MGQLMLNIPDEILIPFKKLHYGQMSKLISEYMRKYMQINLSSEKKIEQRKLLANYIDNLDDTDVFWSNISRNYTKQVCFRNYTLDEILEDREKAKKWFKEQKEKFWGRNGSKAINYWISSNKDEVEQFISNFIKKYNLIANKKGLKLIEVN